MMQFTMSSSSWIIWCSSVLLLLASARPSHQATTEEDDDDVFGKLKDLIDAKFSNMELELKKINSRLDSLDEDMVVMKGSTHIVFNQFEEFEISPAYDAPTSLKCGVDGPFQSCHWMNNNNTYQYDHIQKGLYHDLAVGPASFNNQCGLSITLASVIFNQEAMQTNWTCYVVTASGHTVSKALTLHLPAEYKQYKGRDLLLPKKDSKRMRYEESLDHCASMNTVPFIPRSEEDFNFMVQLRKDLGYTDQIRGYYMWLPASDKDEEGHLKWNDKSDASGSPGLKWCDGEELYSNHNSADCALLGFGCRDGVGMAICGYQEEFPMICEIIR